MNQYITLPMIQLFAAGVVGVLAHYISKAGRREIPPGLFRYLFRDYPGYTLATVLALLGAEAGIIALGQIEEMRPHMVVALGFATGWTIDSAVSPPRSD